MKLAFTIVILACWSKLSIANDDYVAPESLDRVDLSRFYCESNILSLNFSNAVITQIGQNFISSHLIACLDLGDNHIETVADGAFNKLPRLTQLYLNNNKFISSQNLFTLGGHENLKVLRLDNTVSSGSKTNITIPGQYPSLVLLSVSNNGFRDIIGTNKTFPKLILLDLSGNKMTNVQFVELLPGSLKHLYLEDNSFSTLSSLKNGSNVVMLTLDNNSLPALIHHSNNPTTTGLWLYALKHLRYLSVSHNSIKIVESDAFNGPKNLTYLNISGNQIESLYPETFAELEYLETLDLSNNQLQKVIEISAVTNITFLSLSCNKIQKVAEYAFKSMPELRELSLSRNQIDEVDVNGFAYLYHLEKLDLSNNKLSSLQEGWAGAFGSLQVLDLSENQFASLESLSLSNTLPLVEVYLATNPLEYLDAASFDRLPKNATVNLAHRWSGSMRC